MEMVRSPIIFILGLTGLYLLACVIDYIIVFIYKAIKKRNKKRWYDDMDYSQMREPTELEEYDEE